MPSDDDKKWVKHVVSLTPGKYSVAKYWDANNEHSVDILSIVTQAGKVCATAGLSQVVQWPIASPPIRSEILADSNRSDTPIENVISTASFFVMKDGWRIKPGVVFEDVVGWYIKNTDLRHLLFVCAYQWGDNMSNVELPGGPIFPLLAVPISDSEKSFIREKSFEALESVWENDNVDVSDWRRRSSI